MKKKSACVDFTTRRDTTFEILWVGSDGRLEKV
jgi:hypothetical protein